MTLTWNDQSDMLYLVKWRFDKYNW